MTTPSPDTSAPHPVSGRAIAHSPTGARFLVLLLALIWPAQLLTAAGVANGMVTAGIAQAFQTTQVVWFGLAYTLVATLLTPVAARLGDVFGKKKIMIGMTAIGLVGDLLVVLGPSYEMVVAGRALAGFYGPIAALVFATARDVFPPQRVGLVSSLIGSSLGLTTAIAPLVAGPLLDAFGFRGPLWFVVFGTVVALLLLFTLPETPRRAAAQRFDILGSVLLGIATLSLILAVNQGPIWGWTSTGVLGLFAATVIAAVVFVLVELRQPEPLVDMKMLRRRGVYTVFASTALLQGTVYAVALVVTLLALFPPIPGVSDGLGWGGTKIALVTAPGQLLCFLIGFLVGRMSTRWDPRRPWLIGSVVVIAGLASFAFLHQNELQIAFSAILFGIGVGIIMATSPLLVLGTVSPEEQGMANGMQVLLVGLVNTIASAVIFTVMAGAGTVMEGIQFYSDASFRDAYLVAGAIVVLSLLVSLTIPRVLKTSEIRSGDALVS